MQHDVLFFSPHFIDDTLNTKAECVRDSLICGKYMFLAKNICIEVYGNSVGTITPILKLGNVHFCVLSRPLVKFSSFYCYLSLLNFKMFDLERNLCRKCSENENEVQFCAHQLKSVRDWFLGWGRGTLKLTSQQRLGFDVVRVSFL